MCDLEILTFLCWVNEENKMVIYWIELIISNFNDHAFDEYTWILRSNFYQKHFLHLNFIIFYFYNLEMIYQWIVEIRDWSMITIIATAYANAMHYLICIFHN